MKTYINKIFSGALLVLLLSLTGCSSDYLNTSPSESIETEQAIATTANAYNALNGISKEMSTQQYYYGQGFAGENAIMRLYENLPSQNYNYNYYASGWAPIHNQTFHLRNTSIYDSYAWAYYYQLIGSANSIILHIDQASGSDVDKQFIKAAALTFRAYAYEKLIHYYCYRWQDSNNGASRGLPLRLDESTDSIPAATLSETYKQIYQDCDSAISYFTKSGRDRNSGEIWIPNINVAHAVYARAALTKEDYNKALTQAKLARDGYALMNTSDYQAGFCDPTNEWIFGSYGSDAENNWYWSYGVQGACNGYYATNMPTGAGTIGHELIQRIPNNDVRKQLFITEDKFPKIDITDSKQVNQTYGILGLNDDKIYNEADSIINAHSAKGKTAAYQSGYYYLDGQLKFWVNGQPGVGYIPFIRSSEMVLIEAEANYFLGNISAAQNDLVELNKNSGRNPNYSCSKTGTSLFDEIKDYRELELWGEGFAWSDYKRWDIPVIRHSFAQGGNAHVAVAKTIEPEDGNKWTWVIPNGEVDYNSYLTNQEK